MKKLILILLSAILFSGISIAQSKTRAIDGKKVKPRIEQDNSQATPAAAAGTPAVKLKKDGTPDMRHKENKEAAKAKVAPAGPTKKDGTPDKRYNANKSAAAPAQK
jgi:hypothetical protein